MAFNVSNGAFIWYLDLWFDYSVHTHVSYIHIWWDGATRRCVDANVLRSCLEVGAAKRCASTMFVSGAYKLWEETHGEKLGIYSYSMLQRKMSQKNGLQAPKFSVSMLNWWRATRSAQSQVQISRRSLRESSQPLHFMKRIKHFYRILWKMARIFQMLSTFTISSSFCVNFGHIGLMRVDDIERYPTTAIRDEMS